MNSSHPIRPAHVEIFTRRSAVRKQEEGYILLTAMFFMALVFISLAVAAPMVAKSIQRDRDLETFHRGMQYRRAVQLYYRKFHAYPPSVDALVSTNNIRFLRKKYIDPITGKDDWKPVMYGQNKTPTAMGFFGQPLSGNASTLAGTGPSGGNGLNGAAGSSTGSSFGSSGSSFGSSGSSFGSSFGSGFGSSDNGSSSGSSGANGTTGSSTDNSSGSTSSSGSGSSSGTGSSSSSSSGSSSGQTFGGAGIIGFSPGSPRQSILVYKKKNHYNEWEFTYDPISDQKMMTGGNAGAIGQPASNTSNPAGSSAFGNPSSGSSFGGSSGSGAGSTTTNP